MADDGYFGMNANLASAGINLDHLEPTPFGGGDKYDDGNFGMKALLRGNLACAGINLNHLEPRPFGRGDEDGSPRSKIKAEAEAFMWFRGISVQDLKKGTFYQYLDQGKNLQGKELEKGEVVDIDEILRGWAEEDSRVPDEAACVEYEQAWEEAYGDPLDENGKIKEATYKSILELEEKMIDSILKSKARENIIKSKGMVEATYNSIFVSEEDVMNNFNKMKERVLTKEEIYGDDGPGIAEMAIFRMKHRSARMGAKFS